MSRAASVVFCIFVATGAVAAENVQWEQAYGADGRNYNPTAIAATADAFFVAGTSAAPGLGGARPEFWLWKISSDSGEFLSESIIAQGEARDRINPSADHIRGIVAGANGGALIVEFEPGDPYFATFDGAGAIKTLERMEIPELSVITVSRLFALDKGQYLAVGSGDGNAFAMKLGAEGNLLWSARSAEANAIVDAVVRPNGSFVAAGLNVEKPAELALLFFENGRATPRVVKFPARKVSIAEGNDGGIVLVGDRSTGDAQDIRIIRLSANGSVTSEVPVPTDDPALMPPYRIARRAADRYLVAGTTQDGIISLYDDQGKITARMQTKRDHKPRHWFLQELTGSPAAALTIVYTGGAELTTRVGLIRFR